MVVKQSERPHHSLSEFVSIVTREPLGPTQNPICLKLSHMEDRLVSYPQILMVSGPFPSNNHRVSLSFEQLQPSSHSPDLFHHHLVVKFVWEYMEPYRVNYLIGQ